MCRVPHAALRLLNAHIHCVVKLLKHVLELKLQVVATLLFPFLIFLIHNHLLTSFSLGNHLIIKWQYNLVFRVCDLFVLEGAEATTNCQVFFRQDAGFNEKWVRVFVAKVEELSTEKSLEICQVVLHYQHVVVPRVHDEWKLDCSLHLSLASNLLAVLCCHYIDLPNLVSPQHNLLNHMNRQRTKILDEISHFAQESLCRNILFCIF